MSLPAGYRLTTTEVYSLLNCFWSWPVIKSELLYELQFILNRFVLGAKTLEALDQEFIFTTEHFGL
jgi:hypothetical protein